MLISFYSLRPNQQFSDISRRVFNAQTYVVFSGPVLLCFSRVYLFYFLKKPNDYYLFVLEMYAEDDNGCWQPWNCGRRYLCRHQYGACQKLNLRKIHHHYKHWRFRCRFCFSQKVDIG